MAYKPIQAEITCTASSAEQYAKIEAAAKLLVEHLDSPVSSRNRKLKLSAYIRERDCVCIDISEPGFSLNHNGNEIGFRDVTVYSGRRENDEAGWVRIFKMRISDTNFYVRLSN